ncbi:MAG: N-acetylmuramoyl-L-alanine amidase [Anaerolineae bacterium]|nr:N-acetylmuramoyl-L-alanine amidase [Candidatus Roseilinea sp.]MDW8448831.1 N-acetylmuramoyl-L-alanine amidase [Anaerolineae bacterium]
MKRTPTRKHTKDQRVQRSNIRRAQASGKRRARAQSQKVAATGVADVPPSREETAVLPSAARRWFIGLTLAVAIAGVAIVALQHAPHWLSSSAQAQATADAGLLEATRAAAVATADANRVGIVSGHRGHDSGAVCDDGLTEAALNFTHATRVAEVLRAEGYIVDVLDEFDPRLRGYRARVLLSIHADSCARINDLATGFKVARAVHSRAPEAEDRLVACLTARYKARTGLRFHANTVTRDMTEYHAFGEIAPETPAAIIETGFMYLDRPLLEGRPEVVAQGITEGLLCFLRGEAP